MINFAMATRIRILVVAMSATLKYRRWVLWCLELFRTYLNLFTETVVMMRHELNFVTPTISMNITSAIFEIWGRSYKKKMCEEISGHVLRKIRDTINKRRKIYRKTLHCKYLQA
ncbi:hypothetical protein ACHAWO_006103 [Cyclotella atomus]|uniref:Uncharacterized protein n=1 Tax=Cyclotella atomus TaxID=382360 RepID=A0ABD3NDJ2_9STRA